MPPSSPAAIAREVLRHLAERRLQPTPDNFRRLYAEISGGPPDPPLPVPLLREIAPLLPRNTRIRCELAEAVDQAARQYDGDAGRQALLAYMQHLKDHPEPAWNALIGQLVHEWERPQSGWTPPRKRSALERVLATAANDTLYERLHGLLRAWSDEPDSADLPEKPPPLDLKVAQAAPGRPQVVGAGLAGEVIEHLRTLLDIALRHSLPAFLAEHPALVQEAERLAGLVDRAESPDALQRLIEPLRKHAYRLELAAADSAELHHGQLRLFRLLLDNIDAIAIDSEWLQQQVEQLHAAITPPATVRELDTAEHQLRQLISTHSQLKQQLLQAQQTLRAILADFLDELARFADHTETYQAQLAHHAERIQTAAEPDDINHVLAAVMHDTRAIQHATAHSQDELETARQTARAAEQHAVALEQQLARASHDLRHDTLTQALNHLGLEELFADQSDLAARHDQALTLARINVDDFAALRESLGHRAGEDALGHLARVIREHLEPEATFARLDADAFVILYPDTEPARAERSLTRLQRQLARSFLLTRHRRCVITFSAGLSQWQAGEPLDELLHRADRAALMARQSGRSKVARSTAAS